MSTVPALRPALLAIGLLAGAAPAPLAAQDAPEAGIPAALDPGAPEGATLTARLNRGFDRYDMPVGPYSRETRQARALSGRVIRSAWRLDDPEVGPAAVIAGYRERLAVLGYEPVFACEDEACGGIDFRFGVELMPAPAMLMDAADFAQLSASRTGQAGAAPAHVSVLASRVLGAVYVQTVAVAPAVPAIAVTADPKEAREPGQEPGPGTAATLIRRLTGFGHVRLRGLDFEPGDAELTAGSAATLDLAATALAARPELAVLIVGHSDNRGSLEENVLLSRRRAEAVRDALVARGIGPARLEAHGAGFLSPIAANASEEGRALNRRVELVLR